MQSAGGMVRQPPLNCAETQRMSLNEALNPGTPLARLIELLDMCDQPRRQYAAEIRAIGTIDYSSAPKLLAAKERLDASAAGNQQRELAEAVALNPNLDRQHWLRALEIAPHAAIRNPLLAFLLIQRRPIIVADHELVALGALASFAMSPSSGSAAMEALVEIICCGLPVQPETFGACFGEMGWMDLPALPANRYCWDGAERWNMRSVAINDAGTAVMDALQASDHARAQEAVRLCESLALRLWDRSDRWKTHLVTDRIPFAPAGHLEFSYVLHTLVREEYEHAEQEVIGWKAKHSTGSVWHRRPGFMSGRAMSAGEDPVGRRWESSDCDGTGDCNDLGILTSEDLAGLEDGEDLNLNDVLILEISEGYGAEDGCAELTGRCTFLDPFPKEEIDRLAGLFGANSFVVEFAKNPKRAICPDCGKPSMSLFASGSCDCGYERESED